MCWPERGFYLRAIPPESLPKGDAPFGNDPGGEGEEGGGEGGGGEEGEGETDAGAEHPGDEEEHGEGGEDVPEGVVGVVGDFFRALFFDEEPDHDEGGHPGEGTDERAEAVGAFGDFRNGDDEGGGDEVFEPDGHGERSTLKIQLSTFNFQRRRRELLRPSAVIWLRLSAARKSR